MTSNLSMAQKIAALPEKERLAVLKGFSDEEISKLEWDWKFWARPEQLTPSGDWTTWVLCAGRGHGKTRVGAEWVREQISKGKRRIALIGPTAADTRDVMVEGNSGLLNIYPESERPLYEPSKRRITWPNGAIATLYSSEEPERLRGPQHDAGWLDELCAFSKLDETYSMFQFGLRLGRCPQCVITTTPKPFPLLKEILRDKNTVVTRGRTSDNRANLAKSFIANIISKYEGTRLGRQELEAEILDDVPGALWSWDMIARARYSGACPEFSYITINIDPSVGDGNKDNDECGLVATALGKDGYGYVLSDESMTDSPNVWANKAVEMYHRLGAHWIVAEANNGGRLIQQVINAVNPVPGVHPGGENVPVRLVHAAQGKRTRAEPVSMLYEQSRIRHFGQFAELETQMCSWSPVESDYSPGRMDALVWGFTALMIENPGEFFCFTV